MHKVRLWITAALLGSHLASAEQIPGRLTALQPIALGFGVTHVLHFAADGRDALIAQSFRDNGNAHGYNIWLVMMKSDADPRWNVVGFDAGNSALQDTVRDDPHTGEDYVSSVRFVHAMLDGKPVTVLLKGTRQIESSKPLTSAARVDYHVFALQAASTVGLTHDYFHLVQTIHGKGLWCNSDLAIANQFSLPIPSDYEGPKSVDGCP